MLFIICLLLCCTLSAAINKFAVCKLVNSFKEIKSSLKKKIFVKEQSNKIKPLNGPFGKKGNVGLKETKIAKGNTGRENLTEIQILKEQIQGRSHLLQLFNKMRPN